MNLIGFSRPWRGFAGRRGSSRIGRTVLRRPLHGNNCPIFYWRCCGRGGFAAPLAGNRFIGKANRTSVRWAAPRSTDD